MCFLFRINNSYFSILFIIFFLNNCKAVFDDSLCKSCPLIYSISPVLTFEGDTVLIKGEKFGYEKSEIEITIQSNLENLVVEKINILFVNDAEIKFIVPGQIIQEGIVIVKRYFGSSFLTSDDLGINPPPKEHKISLLHKNYLLDSIITGKVGDLISLRGFNFGNKIDDVDIQIDTFIFPSISIKSLQPTQIVIEIPKGIPINGQVIVKVNDVRINSRTQFRYNRPIIDSSIISGSSDQIVHIVGNYFSPKSNENNLKIGSENINILSTNSKELIFKVPKNLLSGIIKINVNGYETADTSEFIYIPTASIKTLLNISDTGSWSFDPIDDNIYFIKRSNSISQKGTSQFLVKRFDSNSKSLNLITDQKLASECGLSSFFDNILTYNGEMFLSPYCFDHENQGIHKFLEFNLGTKKIFAILTLPALLNTPIFALENRSSLFVLDNNHLLKLLRFDNELYIVKNYNSDLTGEYQFIKYTDDRLFIFTPGGVLYYNSHTDKIVSLVGNNEPCFIFSNNQIFDGNAQSSCFLHPLDIAFLKNGNGLIVDYGNNLIRWLGKTRNNNNIVKTIAGSVGNSGFIDGLNNRVLNPTKLHITKDQNIYLIDQNNKSLRQIILE